MPNTNNNHDASVPPTPGEAINTRTSGSKPELNDLAVLWMDAQPSVGAFVWASIGNYQDAEDVVQQIATEVAEHFERYNPEKPFLPWVMAIARHRVIDHYRQYAKNKMVFGNGLLDNLEVAASDQSKRTSVEYDALERCISKLPLKSKRLLEMRYLNDLKPQAIAKRIGTTANTVSVALSRVRTRLNDCVRGRLTEAEPSR